ncbi:MAG: hypothetical protein PVSMB7_17650 [Chloroflexota bacterium]
MRVLCADAIEKYPRRTGAAHDPGHRRCREQAVRVVDVGIGRDFRPDLADDLIDVPVTPTMTVPCRELDEDVSSLCFYRVLPGEQTGMSKSVDIRTSTRVARLLCLQKCRWYSRVWIPK